ncbi:hypothetical protein EFP02_07280 [Lactiplantibacillus plantarum]|uniref:DUF7687 domain-containing protein n=1 Tax=Lactiplantibacillus plantarum TaxID=1590 RepID=UPI0021A58886|nr:hypothetical protein [Lactiplantibacillus plantarum]MCT3246853.1 hypothetical protein [Lactiplantibacillus plantarum]
MKPLKNFTNSLKSDPNEFWATVKYLGDCLGYAKRGNILVHSEEDIINQLHKAKLPINSNTITELQLYFKLRKDALETASNHLMNLEQAKTLFYELKSDPALATIVNDIPFPKNKQKGEKRAYAYFTGIINMLTAYSIISKDVNRLTNINYDPRNLATYTTHEKLVFTSSRRFDGAIPAISNPKLVWEIKEYYYTTSFGSRIADGVYETQLDGFELKNLRKSQNITIQHVFLVDAYDTWWNQGKPYLCRIFDTLNQGLVDEVIFGDEVLTEWPKIIQNVI